MIVLRTPRLTLRHFVPDDAAAMFALDDDPEVMRYLPKAPHASVEETRLFLEQYQDVYRRDGFARWAVIEDATGAWLGWSGLRRQPDGEVDVGYRLTRASWRRGFATESARASLAYGFETLGLDRITAMAHPENAASLRVLQKIGLRFEKMGQVEGVDHCHFAVSREEWSRSRG